MKKRFNITGLCVPEKHYMVDISSRLEEIRELIDEGAYFSINRARQYGKTTVLNALAGSIAESYFAVRLDLRGHIKSKRDCQDFKPYFRNASVQLLSGFGGHAECG